MKWPLAIVLLAIALPAAPGARIDDVADESIRQFLAQADGKHQIRAVRRLEAENGKRSGWIEATTDSSPLTGFRYQITAEGGSSIVRDKLREVLDAERDVLARQPARYALARANYTFQPKGVDANGLAAIDVSPKRDDHALIEGTVFLRPSDAGLVRVQGRLVKNPSFWVKKVDITRTYECIGGVNVPVVLQSSVQLRLFGAATMQMTYSYLEIDGRPVPSTTVAQR